VSARGTQEAGDIIALFKRRSRHAAVDAAVSVAVEKQWLRFDGATYTLTPAGAKLGSQTRSRRKTRRVLPF